MMVTEAPLDGRIVELDNPDFCTRDPHRIYRRLRAEAPVFWYEPVGFWALSRHADIREVGSSPVFTTTKGVNISDFKYGNLVAECFPEGAEPLSLLDGPRHRLLRRFVAPAFTPAVISRLRDRIRILAQELIATIESGKPFDFVEKIAVPLPLMVIAELLGLRSYDVAELKTWTDDFLDFVGAVTSREQLPGLLQALEPQINFFAREIEAQRTDPQGGLISTLLDAEVSGERLSDENVMQLCQLVLIAGNETTRNTLTGTMHLLLENPDQMQLLRDKPELGSNAVDEAVRLLSPAIGFMRVATEDYELRGTAIREGDPVFLLYASGNRDEEVFEDPDRFDITRKNANQNVAFGFGPHFCIGLHLARAEVQILFEELLGTFSHFEMTGALVRQPSTIINGYTSLPMMATR